MSRPLDVSPRVLTSGGVPPDDGRDPSVALFSCDRARPGSVSDSLASWAAVRVSSAVRLCFSGTPSGPPRRLLRHCFLLSRAALCWLDTLILRFWGLVSALGLEHQLAAPLCAWLGLTWATRRQRLPSRTRPSPTASEHSRSHSRTRHGPRPCARASASSWEPRLHTPEHPRPRTRSSGIRETHGERSHLPHARLRKRLLAR